METEFCFKCGSKIAEISHPSARASTPENQCASSTSSTKSLSQYLASKAEERRAYNKPNNKAGFKRKVNDPGSSSKRVANNRVVINVGLVTENEEGNLAIVRGSRVALKVGKDYGKIMRKITSCFILIKSWFLKYRGVTKISL